MAHDCFQDKAVAALLNERFISIKVDRQERPDVDAVYMTVCEAMTGSGGWPLTVILTPDCTPLFAGTYFPARNSPQGQGLLDILRAINAVWVRNPEQCTQQATQITEAVSEAIHISAMKPTYTHVEKVLDTLTASYDAEFGGFGHAPKFPNANAILLLLAAAKNPTGSSMAQSTLIRIAHGGIHDHVGGGFMRYTVDRKWRQPHYEKMLYDNALLLLAFTEAYQQTNLSLYAHAIRKTCTWVMREMSLPDGAFASAQDADTSEGEGHFYFWSPEQIQAVLGKEQGDVVCGYLNVRGPAALPYLSQRAKAPEGLEESLETLRQIRALRPAPALDTLIQTAWNALMIWALARASVVLKEPIYLERAKEAAHFIQTRLTQEDGTLCNSTLAEYAYWILALCALYEATQDEAYLDVATLTARGMITRFSEGDEPGFPMSDAPELILRMRPSADDALPAPNAAAAHALNKLVQLGKTEFRSIADRTMCFLAGAIEHQPEGHSFAAYTLIMAG